MKKTSFIGLVSGATNRGMGMNVDMVTFYTGGDYLWLMDKYSF